MDKKDFGVLYGQKTTEDALLIYSSYEDAKASPKMGDFIVLSPISRPVGERVIYFRGTGGDGSA